MAYYGDHVHGLRRRGIADLRLTTCPTNRAKAKHEGPEQHSLLRAYLFSDRLVFTARCNVRPAGGAPQAFQQKFTKDGFLPASSFSDSGWEQLFQDSDLGDPVAILLASLGYYVYVCSRRKNVRRVQQKARKRGDSVAVWHER